MNGARIGDHPLQAAYRQISGNGADWECAATERWGGYWISVGMFERGTEWIATAVKCPPALRGHPMLEPGDLWFEFGKSADEAVERLKRSLEGD